ncbi:hypothetical protein Tco_0999934 [Tanacetum coccineum]
MQKYKGTNQRQLSTELVNIIGKKHIFQFHFTPLHKKGAGEFIVDDILDIQPAIETHTTATSSTMATKEPNNKEKAIPGTPPHESQKKLHKQLCQPYPARKPTTEPPTKDSATTVTSKDPKPSTAKWPLFLEVSLDAKKKKGY